MIIAGFAGIGKTTFCKMHEDAVDFCAMPFKYENFDEIYLKCGEEVSKANSKLILKPDWRDEYYAELLKLHEAKREKIIVIPSDYIILHWLTMDEIPFVLVYPCMKAKEEYKKRFISRGNTQEFLNVFIGNWEPMIKLLQNTEAEKIELSTNRYLCDIIKVIKRRKLK